jgi:iron(III) transport system substrate-binding protein
MGSYALVRAKTDPSRGVLLPSDYTLILSRVQFINKTAKNVNAAKLWLDYILSARGQSIIANDSKLFAIRPDVKGETTSAELIKTIGADKVKPIPVHPVILQYLVLSKRMAFLKQWKETAGKK